MFTHVRSVHEICYWIYQYLVVIAFSIFQGFEVADGVNLLTGSAVCRKYHAKSFWWWLWSISLLPRAPWQQWVSMIRETQSTDSSGLVFVLPWCVSSSLFQLKLSRGLQFDALDVELLVDVISIESKQIIPEVVSFVEGPFFSNQQRWRFHYCSWQRTDEGCNWNPVLVRVHSHSMRYTPVLPIGEYLQEHCTIHVLLDQPALLKKISMLMMTFMIVNGKYMSIEETEDCSVIPFQCRREKKNCPRIQ